MIVSILIWNNHSFCSISFCAGVLEEVILAQAFNIASQLLEENMHKANIAQAVSETSLYMYNTLLKELVPIECQKIVEDAISENVREFLDKRRKAETQNPIVQLVNDILEECFFENTQKAVELAITEAVDEHLFQMKCYVVLDNLIADFIREDFPQAIDAVDLETAVDKLISEVVNEAAHFEVTCVLDDLKFEVEEALRTRDRRAVEARLKEVLIVRLLLGYLMSRYIFTTFIPR